MYLCRLNQITMRSVGSGNHSGVHPARLEASAAWNADHEIAYGDDNYTARVREIFKEQFGPQAEVFPVFNGTGANVVAQRACVRPFNSILCTETAHIAVDECGAPAFMTGASLVSIPTPDGKLTPELIRPHLTNWGFEHHSQPKSVYISQCSELGTVYTCEEIRAIADLIHPHGMYLHVDGARIANAAVKLGKTFKEMTTDCGVDIVSFGGTKNGMLMGESVVVLNPELVPELKYHRKQCAQLSSKMRYLSAQFIAYFENDLWKRNAAHANAQAQKLRQRITELRGNIFTQSIDANILLLKLPRPVADRLAQTTYFYYWNEAEDEIRLVTSWDTTDEDIESVVVALSAH